MLQLVPPPASAKPSVVAGATRWSMPAAKPNTRLVVVCEPTAALPSTLSVPPNAEPQAR